MENFDTILKDNRCLYRYIAGSHLYNLNIESSDVDEKGVFIMPSEMALGLKINTSDEVSDERHDKVWFEVEKYIRMLLKSNPTSLEGLFVPQEKMIMKPSELIMPLFENKEIFLTKECFNPFIGYAISQIRKARGLNKKIVNPMEKRLSPFDFTYTFYKQGSMPIAQWFELYGLDKDCCGLVNIPNMKNIYGVYYDFGAHFEKYGINTLSEFATNHKLLDFVKKYKEWDFIDNNCPQLSDWFYSNKEPKNYRGMLLDTSTELRSSSVSKGEKPICYISYNEEAFMHHCREYKEYKEWEIKRNPSRYESNLNKTYDSKNLCHCFRLMHMGKEIAEGQGMNLERTWDREFLLNVRNHKYEYDELIERLEEEKAELDKTIAESAIAEKVDAEFVNDILINIRKQTLKNI